MHTPFYLANRSETSPRKLAVKDKYDGSIIAEVSLADRAAMDRAIAAAKKAVPHAAALSSGERRDALDHCAGRFRNQREELALLVTRESGKAIRDARIEVERLIETFRLAADECSRPKGEILSVDTLSRSKDYTAFWKRVPIGPAAFITPFNFPLNLVAHKVAPAIAAGCPFVLKPASYTPLSALRIAEVLAETNLPAGFFSVLPCDREVGELLVGDERLRLLSFTGSSDVGWEMKKRAGKKKVVLELGGNAACLVDEGCDLDDCVERILIGKFSNSGQSCISAQRIYIVDALYAEFKNKFVEAVKKITVGDPKRDDTIVGPLISEKDAERLDAWVAEAQKMGSRISCGGKRDGSIYLPTVLENVPADSAIACEEAFGPVALLSAVKNFDVGLEAINASRYGLQAGVFTRDLARAHRAWNVLDVGGVVIGEVPTWRADGMPYGGVKDSGLGREGVRFAIDEMSEIRTLILRIPQ